HFPAHVSRQLDDERRAQFEAEGQLFESDYTLIVQFTPPLHRNSRILDIIYDAGTDERASVARRILAQFKKDLASIEDAIGSSVTLRRMRSFDIVDDDGRNRGT